MIGVVKNTTTGRFFETGQMINHDIVFLKQQVKEDFVAETNVSVLKYEAGCFQQIMDQFPDFYEDIKQMIDDQEEQKKDLRFIKTAINSSSIRGLIVKHYHDIVNEDKKNLKM